MALIDPDAVTRHDIPHEPGQWVEVRTLTAGDLPRRGRESDDISVGFELLASGVKAWSYPVPVSAEAMQRLDLTTYKWLNDVVKGATGLRGDAEKNASSSNSTATTALGAERSPVSSGT